MKNRKYFILGFAGLLLALIDLPVPTGIAYPEFIPFETEAPNTVEMVIGQVIGPVFKVDLCSDFLAYLLILLSIIGLGKIKKYFYRQLPLLGLSMGLLLANTLLPFYLNGNLRFRFGYLFYFLASLAKIVSLFEYTFCFTKMEECMANHTDNTVTVIFMMVSFFAGMIHYVLAFYQLTISSYLYYFVQLATLLYTLYRLWTRRRYLNIRDNI
ncbi:MAG: hypothetical protein ACI4DW_10650 [Lachnospiraceae bacterium]